MRKSPWVAMALVLLGFVFRVIVRRARIHRAPAAPTEVTPLSIPDEKPLKPAVVERAFRYSPGLVAADVRFDELAPFVTACPEDQKECDDPLYRVFLDGDGHQLDPNDPKVFESNHLLYLFEWPPKAVPILLSVDRHEPRRFEIEKKGPEYAPLPRCEERPIAFELLGEDEVELKRYGVLIDVRNCPRAAWHPQLQLENRFGPEPAAWTLELDEQLQVRTLEVREAPFIVPARLVLKVSAFVSSAPPLRLSGRPLPAQGRLAQLPEATTGSAMRLGILP